MKKIFFGILALIVLIGGSGFAWYKVTYGGGTYYVQITKDGKEKVEEQIQAINIRNLFMI